MRFAWILRIVRDMLDECVRLCVLALQPRYEHPAFTVSIERERHRSLRRDECEADVVENVRRVEQHDTLELFFAGVARERGGALPVLGLVDPHAARSFSRQSGSSSRNRATRSPTGGCVTNNAARPSSRNGLIVYSGSVAGLPWNETSSEACSSRTSASAIGWGESQIAAAVESARNSRFGESSRCTSADASGPRKNSKARENQPPTRLNSSSVAASTTTDVWTTMSRCRTWASSCASTASNSAGAAAESRPALTPTDDARGPRPATIARGNPSSIR